VDFLKLVQKKENKTDNKIITGLIILVILIMSAVVFWPSGPKHHLLAYLPDDASFYYHWTNKDTFSESFFGQDLPQDKIAELEEILDNNFLNLQEVLWFKIGGDQTDNYLLSFSRLPKSFFTDLENREVDFRVYSPQKNVLLINRGEAIDNLEANLEKDIHFENGVSIYWQKTQAPEFLEDWAAILESAFVGGEILLNWQESARGKNKLSLIENNTLEAKDIKNFLTPKDFDLVFGFGDRLPGILSEGVLKTFFDSLPYYNLNIEVIKDRILTNAIVWQKDDAWILASDRLWTDDILDFVDSFVVTEVPGVLEDGTAYTELMAVTDQNSIDLNINGQKVSQIGDLFIWDIADQHYLSNDRGLIEEISSHNRYLASILGECLDNDARLTDFAYLKDKSMPKLDMYDIDDVQLVSYATGTISGLNICF
jgi:hypothetical protein